MQNDIQLRNRLQEQRERELSQLQREVADQITDIPGQANISSSHHQSFLDSSSREVNTQINDLERLQRTTPFEGVLLRADVRAGQQSNLNTER